MDTICIEGGVLLCGDVTIQGSKNATLPILAATILVEGQTVLHRCPHILDIVHMVKLLESVGCKVIWEGDCLCVDAFEIKEVCFPEKYVDSMRSSIVLLGAMLGRKKEAVLQYPGGCVIGKRPIDMHLWAMEEMGVAFLEKSSILHARCEKLLGKEISIPILSVGVTENLILAAVLAKGETVIRHAAMEPEIVALCDFLIGAGARIKGHGTDRIVIEGVEKLSGSEYVVTPDRIVAGTYLLATAGCGGEVVLEDVPMEQMDSVISIGRSIGAVITEYKADRKLQIFSEGKRRPIPYLETEVYPGFPTDLQSCLLAVMTKAEGISVIAETIFEDRFRIVPELNRMGARIFQKDNRVMIWGANGLVGAKLTAKELRGGAALVIAGLMAEGKTVIQGRNYIERGYENLPRDLRQLGAVIR